MAIRPVCDNCGKELISFGAVLIGPPNKNSMSKKWHLCQACYKKLVSKFDSKI